jgi:Uma2 family endonuclease
VTTVTERSGYFREEPWTVDDLYDLPDDGMRHELVDGSLVVSPQPAIPHARLVNNLHHLLTVQGPAELRVGQGVGLEIGSRTYFVPDLFVAYSAAMLRTGRNLVPADFLLVVEVLSPSNKGHDLVAKRHSYAASGIPQYWIVDQQPASLTVLRLDGTTYRETAVLKPTETYETDEPFPLRLDLDELF